MSQESNKKMKQSEVFNPALIKKGIVYFVGISIIAFTALFLYTNTGNTLKVWGQIKPQYLLIAVVILFNDLLLGGWRNHLFVQELYPNVSQWVSFRANLANIFMGAVTPSQSGGGLAQLYIYYKNGVSFADAITISFISWLATLIFFPISGALAYWIIQDRMSTTFLTQLAQFGFSLFAILFVIIFTALFFPKFIGWLIVRLSSLVGLFSEKWQEKLTHLGEKTKVTLVDYRNKCIKLLSGKPQLMLYCFLLTIILYFNKYVLAYFLVLAFGISADFWVIIAIQAVVYLLFYFAPSPGGSGIAELSMAGLMAGILSEDYLASFTLLQRSFLVFIPALIGAYVVLRQMKEEV